MVKSPKKKGASKEPEQQPDAPKIEDDEPETKEPEEAQAPSDIPSEQEVAEAEKRGVIYVTIAPYSRKYKELSAKQYKVGAVEAKGMIDLGGRIFSLGEVYALPDDAETEKLMREGILMRMGGSFNSRGVKK